MREKECFRDNLAMLSEVFTNKPLVTVSDVAKWAGRDRTAIKKLYFGAKKYITLAELASKIS